jgi:alpha-beta hydrolase superfamily lysophospholipase
MSAPLTMAFLALGSVGAAGGTCSPTTPGGTDAGPIDAPPADPDAALPDAAPPSDDVEGCHGASYLRNPLDTAERGPNPVGARTVQIGVLTAEVWYPAVAGTDRGMPAIRYDLREQLPRTEVGKVPDDDNPWQSCDCHRDLPLDTAHGPYPVIVFVHGTAGFRHQSLSQVTHWASRGFVVIAADHPGLRLGSLLAVVCPGNPTARQNLSRDIDALIDAVRTPSGQLGFLSSHVDSGRVAVAGHSAGGSAAAAATGKPGVRVMISMAGARSAAASPTLEQVLFLSGRADMVVKWDSVNTAYQSSASPKRLVGLAGARHLAFSDLCDTRNAQGQNLLDIATEHDICGAQFAGQLFDCDPTQLDGPTGWSIINDATSFVLESTLQCRGGLPDPGELRDRHPDVDFYEESL